MNLTNLRRECERETRVKYGWFGDRGPISYSHPRSNWQSHKDLKHKFLTENYRFNSEGRKIKVIGA